MSVGIAHADLAVVPVYEQLRTLCSSDAPRRVDRRPLRRVHRRRPERTGTADRPTVRMRNNVLIAFRHALHHIFEFTKYICMIMCKPNFSNEDFRVR